MIPHMFLRRMSRFLKNNWNNIAFTFHFSNNAVLLILNQYSFYKKDMNIVSES